VHAIELAENSIFTSCVNVARRQLGCMRFCYVPSGCRTPRRYHCQPDGVIAAVNERVTDPTAEGQRTPARDPAVHRDPVRPSSLRATRARLRRRIKRGADDESEMGAYHDLFQPQREANLLARLAEYTPPGWTSALSSQTDPLTQRGI